MKNIENWDTIKKRLNMLWNNEILDRCCVCVKAPKNVNDPYIKKMPSDAKNIKNWYLDAEWILRRTLEEIDKTYYAGEALPILFPYFGTGGHAKYLCDESAVDYGPDTIWIHNVIDNYKTFDFEFKSDNEMFKRELEVIEYIAKEGLGKFLVGLPDNCGSFDALSQLRGNINIMMDTFDKPDEVLKATMAVTDVWTKANDKIFDIVSENNYGGSSHGWMNTWSEGRHMQLQCDASVMMSNNDFEKYIVPELSESAKHLDNAIYHLDGQEQIRHLDSILSVDGIDMIQWVPVSGQPPMTDFIPQLKKIQKAKKGLVLLVNKNEIKPLIEELSPEGVIFNVEDAKDKQEADEIVRYVESF